MKCWSSLRSQNEIVCNDTNLQNYNSSIIGRSKSNDELVTMATQRQRYSLMTTWKRKSSTQRFGPNYSVREVVVVVGNNNNTNNNNKNNNSTSKRNQQQQKKQQKRTEKRTEKRETKIKSFLQKLPQLSRRNLSNDEEFALFE